MNDRVKKSDLMHFDLLQGWYVFSFHPEMSVLLKPLWYIGVHSSGILMQAANAARRIGRRRDLAAERTRITCTNKLADVIALCILLWPNHVINSLRRHDGITKMPLSTTRYMRERSFNNEFLKIFIPWCQHAVRVKWRCNNALERKNRERLTTLY